MSDFDIRHHKDALIVKEAVISIIDSLNTISGTEHITTAFFNGITSQHRTLQQDFIRTLYDVLVAYSELEYYDGRNEAAVKFAKQVAELDVYLPRI